jgi:hypothetical protein
LSDLYSRFTKSGEVEYKQQVLSLFNTQRASTRKSLYVDFMHMREFDLDLATEIQLEYYRYVPLAFVTFRFELYLRKGASEYIMRLNPKSKTDRELSVSEKDLWIHIFNFPTTQRFQLLFSFTL